jgi:hypothetical protein
MEWWIPKDGSTALALRGLWILGLTSATCGCLVGCSEPGWLPSATVPPNVQPSQSRMLNRNATLTAPSSTAPSSRSLEPAAAASDLSVPSIDAWKPSAPAKHWTWVVLHHTASSHGSVESIHAAHLKRKDRDGRPWLGIGYHFVIGNGNGMPDGRIEPTFRWKQQLAGAHAGDDEHNQRGIGIVLVGNFDEARPTEAQLVSLRRLVATLQARYGIAKSHVIRHSDLKATACPGKLFPLAEITQEGMEPRLGTQRPAANPTPAPAQERNRP